MDKFIERARELQRGVQHDELGNLGSGRDDYSEEQTRQAIVHTRLDTVLVVSLLLDLNRQVRRLTWLIFVLVVVAGIVVTRQR